MALIKDMPFLHYPGHYHARTRLRPYIGPVRAPGRFFRNDPIYAIFCLACTPQSSGSVRIKGARRRRPQDGSFTIVLAAVAPDLMN